MAAMKWLSLDQITERVDLLRDALTALRGMDDTAGSRGDPNEKLLSAFLSLARCKIRDAERDLIQAEQVAWKVGGAKVGNAALDVAKTIRRVGVLSLRQFARR